MKFLARFVNYENKIKRATEKATRNVLQRMGAYVRKIARDHVRHKKDPNVYSEPYKSPYDHFGLKRSILFAKDKNSAYIGPRLIRNGMKNVARLHEFGGEVQRKVLDMSLWNGVTLGAVAPVTTSYVTRKDPILKSEAKSDPKTGRKVVWIRIRTKRQADHSTRLYHRFMRKNAPVETVIYPPRPYMLPALKKSLPGLPGLWKNAIHN